MDYLETVREKLEGADEEAVEAVIEHLKIAQFCIETLSHKERT